jgi:hypothetical protein
VNKKKRKEKKRQIILFYIRSTFVDAVSTAEKEIKDP